MDVVAVIPARGGSKGIPRKNLQPIDGIPLVGWSIRAALAAESIDRVYVSTEDREIAEVAESFGAEVIPRPGELAADEAATLPVLQHAAKWIPDSDKVGAVVCLACTSPLTSPSDIDGVVAIFQADPRADVVTTVCRDHSYQLRETPEGIDWVSFDRAGQDQRRQDLPKTYRLTGGVVLYRISALQTATCSFSGNVRLYEIPQERAVDVDSPVDLHVARAMAGYRDHWIVIGSSPSVRKGLAAARATYPVATTITTNSGHELFAGADRPDYYHLHDSVACVKHRDHALAMAAKGTRTITLYRASRRALKIRHVEWFDEFLRLTSHDHPGRFTRGAYASCGLSGLMILQYALNHGARTVHLVGMEGYGDEGHYFNGEPDMGPEKNARFTKELIQPFVQSCIDACPEVHFLFYGNLNYTVKGKNVRWLK